MSEPTYDEAEEATPAPEGDENTSGPERSTIKFPYSDIDDAWTLAVKIKDNYGRQCDLDQLAATLNNASIMSGAFRTKVATASTFGALTTGRGRVTLTPLGHRLADEETRPAALVEAFLNVPLYRRIYDRYRNTTLPGDAGLSSEIHEMGVKTTQVERARQTLQRSAEKAGFFRGGRTRLVRPPTDSLVESSQQGTDATPERSSEEPPRGAGTSDNGASVAANPLISALFAKMLPPEDAKFPKRDRERLMRALTANLDVIYGEAEDDDSRMPGAPHAVSDQSVVSSAGR